MHPPRPAAPTGHRPGAGAGDGDGDDLDEEPAPGTLHELSVEEVADRRRRRSLATIVVVSGGVTWTALVVTVCVVTVRLALVAPGQLQGFALVAYPSLGGATVVVAVLERLVTCLGPRGRRVAPSRSDAP